MKTKKKISKSNNNNKQKLCKFIKNISKTKIKSNKRRK